MQAGKLKHPSANRQSEKQQHHVIILAHLRRPAPLGSFPVFVKAALQALCRSHPQLFPCSGYMSGTWTTSSTSTGASARSSSSRALPLCSLTTSATHRTPCAPSTASTSWAAASRSRELSLLLSLSLSLSLSLPFVFVRLTTRSVLLSHSLSCSLACMFAWLRRLSCDSFRIDALRNVQVEHSRRSGDRTSPCCRSQR